MNVIRFFIIGVTAMLQVTVLSHMQAYAVSGNVVLALIVLFLFLYNNHQHAVLSATGAGLFLDAYSGVPFGTITASMLFTVVVLILFSRILPREHFLHFLLYAVLGVGAFYSAIILLMKISNFSFIISGKDIVVIGVYTIVVMALMYGISKWNILSQNRINGR